MTSRAPTRSSPHHGSSPARGLRSGEPRAPVATLRDHRELLSPRPRARLKMSPSHGTSGAPADPARPVHARSTPRRSAVGVRRAGRGRRRLEGRGALESWQPAPLLDELEQPRPRPPTARPAMNGNRPQAHISVVRGNGSSGQGHGSALPGSAAAIFTGAGLFRTGEEVEEGERWGKGGCHWGAFLSAPQRAAATAAKEVRQRRPGGRRGGVSGDWRLRRPESPTRSDLLTHSRNASTDS